MCVIHAYRMYPQTQSLSQRYPRLIMVEERLIQNERNTNAPEHGKVVM